METHTSAAGSELDAGMPIDKDADLMQEKKEKKRFLSPSLELYCWVAAVTAVLLVILFAARQIYPFGDKVLRYTDGDQNFAVLGYLQNALYGGDNLLYTWSAVLGANPIGMLAFYGEGPLGLLIALFPNDLMAGYHFIFAVKFVAAAVCFAVMLHRLFPSVGRKAVVLFAASYPFIGYMTYYAWNQSWMDGIILLPLITLGLTEIIRCRKLVLYTVSLGILLMSNYYMGYVVCIASILCFVGGMVLSFRKWDRTLWKTVLYYLIATAASAALAAVVLLPAYYGLPKDRQQEFSVLLENIEFLSRPMETLSMLYTAPYNNMGYVDNGPVIYTGIVQLVLAVLFFLNKDIPGKYRAAAGILLLIFAASFAVSALNIAWHAFTVNVWFNYRYSFLVSFILEVLAFYSFTHLRGARSVILAGGATAALITVLALGSPRDNLHPDVLLLDLVWICAALVLFRMYSDDPGAGSAARRSVCFLLIAAITFANLLQNAYLSLSEMEDVQDYEHAELMENEAKEIIDDDGFYRRGSLLRYGRCDPLQFGYAGAEGFMSTESEESLDSTSKLGFRGWRWRREYGNNVPLSTDALLGIKYVVADDSSKALYYPIRGISEYTYAVVLENPNALPIVFPADERSSPDAGAGNKFQYMNSVWNSVTPVGGDVFSEVSYDLEEEATSDGSDLHIRFTAPEEGPIYAQIPDHDITVEGVIDADAGYQDLFFVGEFLQGEAGEIIVHTNGNYEWAPWIVLYEEHPDVVEQKASVVNESGIQTEKQSSSHLVTHYDAEEDGMLTSTIPFDQGWTVYIDGQKADVYRNMDYFLAFDVPKGEHEIELVYWPPYLTAGTVISISTAAAIAIFAVWQRRRRRGTPAAACLPAVAIGPEADLGSGALLQGNTFGTFEEREDGPGEDGNMRSEDGFQSFHADPLEAMRHNHSETMPRMPEEDADSAASSADQT